MNARPVAFALMLALAPTAVSLPRLAHAQQGAQDDALTKAARARFQEGVDAFDKGNYEAARASFKQAYALKQHPAVLLNLAQSSLKSGHYLESAKMFQQYIVDPLGDARTRRSGAPGPARASAPDRPHSKRTPVPGWTNGESAPGAMVAQSDPGANGLGGRSRQGPVVVVVGQLGGPPLAPTRAA